MTDAKTAIAAIKLVVGNFALLAEQLHSYLTAKYLFTSVLTF